MTDVGEAVSVPIPQPHPPHIWVEVSRETPDQTKQRNTENAENLAKKPSKATQAKGPTFENKAIDANMTKMPIEATSLVYKCSVAGCTVTQEVDILGQNNQIAETKSRTAKGVKSKSDQCKRLNSIQAQLNKEKGTSNQPLAKIDKDRTDAAESAKIYDGRGFAVERL